MASFVFSEFVRGDLAVIWDYIALDNLDAADRFLELAMNPEIGQPRRFPGSQLRSLRSFRIKGFENYLIFYRPVSEGIEVLNVLHGARDLDKFWKDE
jgi:toxin ParE1/3/4